MSSDTIRIMCPNLACRKILGVPTRARGKTVKCRSCGTAIRIPEGAEPKAPASGNSKD